MIVTPGWQDRIWAYHFDGAWISADAVFQARELGKHAYERAFAYTLPMLCRRYEAGGDVPEWAVEYIERALGMETVTTS